MFDARLSYSDRTCSFGIAPASSARNSSVTAAVLSSQPLRSSCRIAGQAPQRTASLIAAQPASPTAPANSESFSRLPALASAVNTSGVRGTVFSAAGVQGLGLQGWRAERCRDRGLKASEVEGLGFPGYEG